VARPIGTADEVTTRVQTLRKPFDRIRTAYERLDNWRYMDSANLRAEIWPKGAPQNANRWTIIKPDIAATTETVISFTTTKRPKITVTARNTVSLPASDGANQVERLGYAIYDTIERDRDTPLVRETADSAFHRGVMITKILRLSLDERGAETATIDPPSYDDPSLDDDGSDMEVVVSEEQFPMLVQALDIYECAYLMKPNGQLAEFVHEYDDSPDSVLLTFPDLEGNADFAEITDPAASGTVKITDYWTEEEHCILINDQFFKKPTRHEYPGIPIVVDLAAPRKRRYSDRGAYAREGTPFCANIVDTVAKASMAESWMLAQLEEVAFSPLIHKGIDPDDSPYMKQGAGNASEYVFEMELGPSKKVIPAFTNTHGNENFEYLNLPPVAPALMTFMGGRARDSALLAFPDEMMMGAGGPAVSGYAYAQMKHGVMSKTAPYFAAINRHLSRVFYKIIQLLVHDWDRAPDMPLTLVQLVGQQNQQEQTLEVTKELLASISNVKVEIQPDMPVDLEKEWTMYFQAHAQQLMTARTAMNLMGIVEDPTIEYENIIFEQFAATDQNTVMAIVQKVLQRNGYQSPQPQQQAPVAPVAPQPGMPPPGVMPPDPMGMTPQLPPGDPMAAMAGGMDPMAAGGGTPSELLAMMQQQGGMV
jgi:hypothetical protein